jgi:hypothetical protein
LTPSSRRVWALPGVEPGPLRVPKVANPCPVGLAHGGDAAGSDQLGSLVGIEVLVVARLAFELQELRLVDHFWLLREHPAVGGGLLHEAFAVWLTATLCGVAWEPDELATVYALGRALGSALAGGDAALAAIAGLEAPRRDYAVGLLYLLGGKRDPRALARLG